MIQLIVSRLLQVPLILLAVYTGLFVLTAVAPGDPMHGMSDRIDTRVLEEKRRQYGYDLPAWQRYFIWLNELMPVGFSVNQQREITGFGFKGSDLGRTLPPAERRINEILWPNLQHSMFIGALALMTTVLIGTTIGCLAAVGKNGPLDWVSLTFVLVGISLPSFVTAAALTFVFSLTLGWLPLNWVVKEASPTVGSRIWDLVTLQWLLAADPAQRELAWLQVRQLFLPVVALSLFYTAYVSRLTRNSMIEALSQDYVRTARAKGCSWWTVVRSHALRNSLLPVISFLGPAAAGLLTGGFVVERFYNIPGMAEHFIAAVLSRDLRLLLVVTMIYSLLIVLFNLVADVLYGLVDPRIRRS